MASKGPKEEKSLAREFDRAFAAELARLYRERHPRSPPRGATGAILGKSYERKGVDIGEALDYFATRGTWEKNAEDNAPWNAMACRLWYARLRDHQKKEKARLKTLGLPRLFSVGPDDKLGLAPADAIEWIAKKSGLGCETVRSYVHRKKYRPDTS